MGKQHLAEQHQLPYSYDNIEDAITSKFCKELVIGIDAMWKELVEKFNFLLGEVDNAFGIIAVSGEDNVVADSPHDTVTLVEGNDVVITTNGTTSTITFAIPAEPSHTHDGRYYTEAELDGGQLDNRYFREDEHINSSAGAGDAGKPIKLDAGGRIDDSMVEGSEVVKHALADAANDFLVASGADAFVKKTLAETGAILESDIEHDNLQGFVGNEHIDHSAVAVNAGGILSGGGDLTATRTISLAQSDVDHGSITGILDDDHPHYLLVDGSRSMTGNLTVANANVIINGNQNYLKVLDDGGCLIYLQTADAFGLVGTFSAHPFSIYANSVSALAFDTSGEVILGSSQAVLDEDNLASDSDSQLATQQSIKAYVDDHTWVEADITDLGSYIENVVEDTTPQLGGDLDLNGKNINLGSILSSNGTYEGKILTVTVDDASAAFGNVLAQASDFHYDRADASAATTSVGLVLALESGSGSKKILIEGMACNTAWSWSAGLLYLSATTGEMTQTAPSTTGDQVIAAGWALSATCIYFKPSLVAAEAA